MPSMPRVEPIAIDSTAMSTFKKCPRMYFYKHVLGYVPLEDPVYITFGQVYHKFREILEERFMLNAQPMPAFKEAKDSALALWNRIKPARNEGEYAYLNTDRLVASMNFAFEHWLREKTENVIQVITVEQSFAIILEDEPTAITKCDKTASCTLSEGHEGECNVIVSAGKIDQVTKWRGNVKPRDFKTTKKNEGYYNRSLEPNDQMIRYMHATSLIHGLPVREILVEVLYNTKTVGPEIYTLKSERTNSQLERWRKDHTYWTDQLRKSRETDTYPMNETQCSYCPFRKICTTSSENGMLGELRGSYKYKPWDCTNVEED